MFKLSRIFIVSVLLSSSFAMAGYWNEKMCSWGLNGSSTNLKPGQTISVSYSVSAQRDATSQIPVTIYYGLSQNWSPSDIVIASGLATVYYGSGNDPFCSNTVISTGQIPTSTGASCFAAGNGYIHFKTGDDVKTVAVTIGPTPSISSVSPSIGFPGDEVTITGSNFTASTTNVYFDGISAPHVVESANTITAYVPEGATTGKVSVQGSGSNWSFCIPPSGLSTHDFVVPEYCASGAAYQGYGNIEYFASDNFTYNTIGTTTCNNYTDNTWNYATSTTPGSSKQFQIQFGTCNATEYARLFKMYIDWNRDGDFADPGEFIVDAPSVAASTGYTITVSVPSNASIGVTRIRLITALYYSGIVDSSSDVDSCTVVPFGETQDYSLVVTASSAKQGTTNLDNPVGDDFLPMLNNPKSDSVYLDMPILDLGILHEFQSETQDR